MASDLNRRLKMLEASADNASPRITKAEIGQAVDRYERDRGGYHDHTPTSCAFRTMLYAMRPAVARLYLPAHPVDLML